MANPLRAFHILWSAYITEIIVEEDRHIVNPVANVPVEERMFMVMRPGSRLHIERKRYQSKWLTHSESEFQAGWWQVTRFTEAIAVCFGPEMARHGGGQQGSARRLVDPVGPITA
ncbi:hypothetical protein N7517_001153 [Penicillium concentricum]|uniref:Uncharacterized protein n=1 Tax=Penicillium concentricum TaxID=293559 RepID=A0A9W9SRC8_9EURO|nr:uncharacterized protein N7517_001153 [Penicillium concentricum]KAJ5383242.1 hypothetical protein N7517_001153 [Penicillium concentricum]